MGGDYLQYIACGEKVIFLLHIFLCFGEEQSQTSRIAEMTTVSKEVANLTDI